MNAWSWRSDGADLGLALALVVAAQVELFSTADQEWWRHAAAFVGTAPLAVRRRFPAVALAAALVALGFLTVRGVDDFPVGELLALMLSAYTVAAHLSQAPAAAGLAATLFSGYINAYRGAGEPGDYVFATILLTVPWMAGRGLRAWRDRADELARLADELEASRAEYAQLVVVAERGRIARDLHDSLAQTLNAVVVHAEVAEAALGDDESAVRHSLARITEVSRDSLGETRRLLGSLRGDQSTVGSPRLADLDRLVTLCREQGHEVEVRQLGEARPLGAAIEAAAYRILQECLTNVRRHAAGSRVMITIEHRADDLLLEVRNTAPPRPAEQRPGGFGLVGMRERANLLGGELTTANDDGFTVRARLPREVTS